MGSGNLRPWRDARTTSSAIAKLMRCPGEINIGRRLPAVGRSGQNRIAPNRRARRRFRSLRLPDVPPLPRARRPCIARGCRRCGRHDGTDRPHHERGEAGNVPPNAPRRHAQRAGQRSVGCHPTCRHLDKQPPQMGFHIGQFVKAVHQEENLRRVYHYRAENFARTFRRGRLASLDALMLPH